jgi:hypothetical protein
MTRGRAFQPTSNSNSNRSIAAMRRGRQGRKRKLGSRYASGDIVRPGVERRLAAKQPHRAWLPERQRLDQRAASPFGCLNLFGVLTDRQYRAGMRYAAVVGKYRAVIESPRATAGTGRGYDCPGDLACGRDSQRSCECRERKARYDAAFAALSEAGQRATRAVARVAVYGEQCPTGALDHLKRGLDALAVHFGLLVRRPVLAVMPKAAPSVGRTWAPTATTSPSLVIATPSVARGKQSRAANTGLLRRPSGSSQ